MVAVVMCLVAIMTSRISSSNVISISSIIIAINIMHYLCSLTILPVLLVALWLSIVIITILMLLLVVVVVVVAGAVVVVVVVAVVVISTSTSISVSIAGIIIMVIVWLLV